MTSMQPTGSREARGNENEASSRTLEHTGRVARPRLGAFLWLSLGILLLAACAQPPAEAPEATATPRPTVTRAVPQVVATRAPTAVATPEPLPAATITAAAPTETPTPSPTPTSGPLNESVPAPPKGGYECGDFPCPDDAVGWEAHIAVPPGFVVAHLTAVPGKPNSIAFGPDGLLYVATMEGQIWVVAPDGASNLFVEGFTVPVALAFEPGTERLYVSSRAGPEEAQVSVIEGDQVRQILGGIPCCYAGMHAANGIAFGPDGYGYVAVGAQSDHGEVLNSTQMADPHPWEATILRFSPEGVEAAPFARGLRNAYDIAWDGSGRLFAADNGPDFGPPDEFHLIEPGGEHGFPWYDCEECFSAPPEAKLVPPLHALIPHGAPAGITAYLADQFPGYYNNLFLTLWSAFEGAQKVIRFGPGGIGMTDFATGFAAPIDVTVGPEGSLYVADWATGVLVRISYGEDPG